MNARVAIKPMINIVSAPSQCLNLKYDLKMEKAKLIAKLHFTKLPIFI